MTGRTKNNRSLTPAVAAGLIAFLLSAILAFYRIHLAVIPLVVFLILCAVAPFCPSWPFFLPLVSHGPRDGAALVLTFDDGPDPLTTRPLLALLERYGVFATFFVVGEKAARYGELVAEILARGHEVGNHSYSHDPFLMLRPMASLVREIERAQRELRRFAIAPCAFRPPVGITSPKLASALGRLGLWCATFSCRAYDCGNRFIGNLSGKILKKVRPGDIVLLHDVAPRGRRGADVWLGEIESILQGINSRGWRVVPLAELVHQPVMVRPDEDCLH